MRKNWFLLIILTQLSCSTEMNLPEQNQSGTRRISSLTIEKPGFPNSDYRIQFDEKGKPLSFSSLNTDHLFRTFEYGSDGKLYYIRDFLPQEQLQEFEYRNNRLSNQTTFIDQSEILLEYIYNENEVQVLRFIDGLYHSTIFFVFSDDGLQFVEEIRSYDGGGQLRHRYLLDYDLSGNVISEEHFRYDIFVQEMVLERRIEQLYDQRKNPLYDTNQPGWMPAWHMAHLDSESIIENISRFASHNVLSRTITTANGQSKIMTFQYEYDAFGFPLSSTRTTDGEFDIRKYRYQYFYN